MIEIHPYCRFKTELIKERAQFLHETVGDLMYAMSEWCEKRGVPFVVTDTVSTMEEDRKLARVSATHREARAFDVSVREWLSLVTNEFISHFEKEWGAMAAIGMQTGEPTLILQHEVGHEGQHFHVQLNRTFAIADPLRVGVVPPKSLA